MPLPLVSRRLIPRTAGSTSVGLPRGRLGKVTAAFPFLGSDKEAILELITSRSNRQRQEICQNYKSLYGKVTMTIRGLERRRRALIHPGLFLSILLQLSFSAGTSALLFSSLSQAGIIQP